MTLKQLLEKTGRTLYINDEVLATAPDKVDGALEFFTIGKYITPQELADEYRKLGLVPADLYTLVEHDTELDEKKYVATQWQDVAGEWCCAAFDHWDDGERRVDVLQGGNGWGDRWWFAGIRKSELETSENQNSLDTSSLEEAIKIVKDAGYKVIKEM